MDGLGTAIDIAGVGCFDLNEIMRGLEEVPCEHDSSCCQSIIGTLGSDFERIGGDFAPAIEKERKREQTQQAGS